MTRPGDPGTVAEWREAVMNLAYRYYEEGHTADRDAAACGSTQGGPSTDAWVVADCHRGIYSDLCALVARLDPRPGAPEAPARPW